MKQSIAALLCLFVLYDTSAIAQSIGDKVSSYRAQHRETRVSTDTTLTRIAQEQADAMAAKDDLDHNAAGDFSRRIAPSGAGRAAENIAYGNTTFDKTLDQWIRSPSHRKNLLLRNASRFGVANAKSGKTGRTYWAMVIAGDYDKSGPKAAKTKDQTSKSEDPPKARAPKASKKSCNVANFLGLCF